MTTIPFGLKRAAVICVLKNGSRFLLLKRLKEPNKDLYTPVGGKLDPFETPLAAAIRETREETSISARHLRYGGILTESSPTEYNWTCYVYVAEIDFQQPPACNEGTLEWISMDEVLNLPTPKTDWFIYKYLLEGKPFAFDAEYDASMQLRTMREEIEGATVFQWSP